MSRPSVWTSFIVALLALFAVPAVAATFIVTNTSDLGLGSFRQALLDANSTAGLDTITFNIPGAGVHTITTPATDLPNITSPVLIDGYTQPGSAPNTNALNAGINAVLQIEIAITSGGDLHIGAGADGTTIRGLVINNQFDEISLSANNVTIAGNFIGTNASGTLGKRGTIGIVAQSTASNLTVGGPAAADRNLISGHIFYGVQLPAPSTTGHLIQGNYIGTDISGTLSLDTPTSLQLALADMGGVSVLDNLISGNSGGGVHTISSTTLRGNLIGTKRDGTSALPNGYGVLLQGIGSTVGGSAAGQPNIIAFNTGNGVNVDFASSGNRISQNSIYSNTALGITLTGTGVPLANDAGDPDSNAGNHGQNYPVIASGAIVALSATISGSINSNASTALHLEFFANAACDATGNGEGQTFIGSTDVTTNASGNATFGPLVLAVPAGQSVITSTATSPAGDTSEFSQCFSATSGVTTTTTALVSSVNPSTVGQSVTFTATVTGASPTGTVQFKDGVANLGSPATVSGGVATFSTTLLTQGTHPITAVYSGDVNNATSTSPLVNQVVNAAPPGATTTAVISSLNPSVFGQSVTFTATVTGNSPTGTVQFKDGAGTLGAPVTLSGGVAAFTTSALSVGTHPITAVYSSDASNAASTSPPLNQVVNAAVPIVTPAILIPTLSELSLLTLGLLLMILGVRALQRRL
jgi:Bacterial Ig-like domain (group 3)